MSRPTVTRRSGAGRRRPLATGAAVAAALTVLVPSTAADAAAAVQGTLLPAPAGATDTRAVDVTALGVIAGQSGDTAQRWAGLPALGFARQQLATPVGATGVEVKGLTDRAELGGTAQFADGRRAVRWSVDGRTATVIGDVASQVDAVGPDGPWGTETSDPVNSVAGTAALVARDGTSTPLQGTPALDAGYRRGVGSIGAARTALVWVLGGVGRGSYSTPVVYRDGASVALPVESRVFQPRACASTIQADGTVAYSGFGFEGDSVRAVLAVHRGGVPGQEIQLGRTTEFPPTQPFPGLACDIAPSLDKLAADGGVAGTLYAPGGGNQAAYWDAAGNRTVVPLAAGETASYGAVVADGGRMVVQAQGTDGVARLSFWRAGVRTALSTPAGWTVSDVVELTDRRLLVANATDASGAVRPIAWTVPSAVWG